MMSFRQAMNPTNLMNTPNITSDDPMNGAHCCLVCRKEIKRLNLTLMGRPFRPLPVCNCVKEKFFREERERELAEKRARILRLYGDGLMDDELKRASFTNFEQRTGTENGYKIAKMFVEKFKEQDAGLYLFGPVGNGKSHLAASIHHQLLGQGYASVFINVNLLFRKLKSTFGSNSQKSDFDYINAAMQCEILTLDEIGLKPLSEYEFGVLYDILDGRKGKITNFTSNLDFKRLREWLSRDKDGRELDPDGRAFDRIVGSALPIRFQAESSYREYKLQQRLKALQEVI
ncbi:ATP-binding protein [Laceyella sacchari]|uniref:ATP-binding protein n=1 Tax=Laceyella sacchari TaxID=37482 RepID=UPI00104D9705|nr:ATP-binding protein [Laceyella sacchari]